MKKLGGVVRQTLNMMDDRWLDDDVIVKLQQDFSSLSTINRAREEMHTLTKGLNQPISVYVYNYAQIHYLVSGHRAHQEDHPFAIQEFIASLETNLKRLMAKTYMDIRTRPTTL